MKGMLVTLEGIDGCGKTTQSRKLRKYLMQRNYDILLIREPGGEKIAERIREVLLDRRNSEMSPLTELLLYSASRAQLVDRVILPALRKGKMVICDRFYDSTLAYQGYGRKLNRNTIEYLNRISACGIIPDLTILMDLPVVIALKRKRKKMTAKDRLEQESMTFHRRVRNGYLRIAQANKKRFEVVNSNQNIGRTWLAVKRIVDDFLDERRIDDR